MTREQAELLLVMIDLKLEHAVKVIQGGPRAPLVYNPSRSLLHETKNAEFLDSFGPPPESKQAEEPKEEQAYWQITLRPDLKDLGRTFDPTREFAMLPQVKQIVSAGQDPMTQNVTVRYYGYKLEEATPWAR